MKNVTTILASLMIFGSVEAFAARPDKTLNTRPERLSKLDRPEKTVKPERIKKINPVLTECIKPFKEELSKFRAERKAKFDEIKASFRSGEISEADLSAQLEKAALEIETLVAALETSKEVCLAQFEESEEEIKEEIVE